MVVVAGVEVEEWRRVAVMALETAVVTQRLQRVEVVRIIETLTVSELVTGTLLEGNTTTVLEGEAGTGTAPAFAFTT